MSSKDLFSLKRAHNQDRLVAPQEDPLANKRVQRANRETHR